MNSYCFQIREANSGQKLSGGMIHAESMEDAGKRVIQIAKIETEKIEHGAPYFFTDYNFKLNGKKVYVSIGYHADNAAKSK